MEYELNHSGVKGMKWGVRRYQNADGSLTPEGKKRYSDGADANAGGSASAKPDNRERNMKIAKGIGIGVLVAGTVATAAVLYAKNPKAVNDFISKAGQKTVDGLKNAGNKAVESGKTYLKNAADGAQEGIKEGFKEGPKKAAKAVVTGVAMMGAKRLMDSTVGKEEAARIFQANNNKKIGSFWKVSGEDKEDNDDD